MAMPIVVPTYTIDQLDGFPDDGNRYELLDGFLLVTPAPSLAHQAVLGRLYTVISQYLSAADLAYAVSPGAVERAPKTHLEPDILVLPNTVPISAPWGATRSWWLVVENLSRSSRKYDLDFKRPAYLDLGVREVWIVDPLEKEVRVSQVNGPTDLRVHDVLRWHPPEMKEAVEIDLATIFRGLP